MRRFTENQIVGSPRINSILQAFYRQVDIFLTELAFRRIVRSRRPGALHIGVGLRGHIAVAQPPVQQILHQLLHAGEDGYAQEHTQHTAEAAAHQNSHDDPEAGDAGGVAQDLRPQNVAVKLLEHHDEDHKEQALLGTDQQNKEGRGDSPQKRPEKRDDVGHAHHHADQRGIGHLQNGTPDEAQCADDERVQQLPPDKAGENAVDLPRTVDDGVGLLLVQHRVYHLAAAGQAFLLHGHQIDGHDDAHDQVGSEADHAPDTVPDAAGQGAQRPLCPRQDVILQQGHAIAVILGHKVRHPDGDLILAVQQAVGPVVHLIVICLRVVDEHGHAVHQLGDQHTHQQIHQQDGHRLCQQDAGKPQDARRVFDVLSGKRLLPPGVERPLDPVHHRCQQVGDGAAVQHRCQHGEQLVHKVLERAAHIERVVKHQHGADGEKRRQPPLYILCPPFHPHHSFALYHSRKPPVLQDFFCQPAPRPFPGHRRRAACCNSSHTMA